MKKAYLIVFIIVAILIGFQFLKHSPQDKIRPRLIDLAKFPLKISIEPVKALYHFATLQNRYEQRISELEERLARLNEESVRMREVVEENQRLRSLLLFKNKIPSRGIAAEVIAKGPLGIDSFIIIDKGSADGVLPNMSVAKEEGLIGRVFEAGGHTSKVMLIDNPNLKIAAMVQRTREQGVLVGLGGGFCKIIYLPYDTDTKPGDIVVASEVSVVSPKGILIGEVEKVLKSPSALYANALVKPSCSLFKIEEVLCIE